MTDPEALAKAFKACLLPEYEAAPTPEQKTAVMAEIMRLGMVWSTTFIPGDPNGGAYREGGRNLALSILGKVDMDLTGARKFKETHERRNRS